jgi:hypothetical protein
MIQNIYPEFFDTFRTVKNLFAHSFEHNLNFIFLAYFRLTGQNREKNIVVSFFVSKKLFSRHGHWR